MRVIAVVMLLGGCIMHESTIINRAVLFVKEQTGITLELDDHFNGLQVHNDRIFFNVVLSEPCFDSLVFTKLQSISGNKKTVKSVEPNGYKRIAIFVT